MADFLAEANRKKVKEQAARDARDSAHKAKAGASAKPVRAGFRQARKPTKRQQNR